MQNKRNEFIQMNSFCLIVTLSFCFFTSREYSREVKYQKNNLQNNQKTAAKIKVSSNKYSLVSECKLIEKRKSTTNEFSAKGFGQSIEIRFIKFTNSVWENYCAKK